MCVSVCTVCESVLCVRLCAVFPPQALRGVLWEDVFLRVRLWEFQQVNVEKAVEQFHNLLHSGRTAVTVLNSTVF